MKGYLPWAALILSFILFLGSGVIQLNAWNINARVDAIDARSADNTKTLSGLVKVVESNTNAVQLLLNLALADRKQDEKN